MKARLAVLAGAFLSIAGIALAAGSTADPFIGHWKLDAAKSKFTPGPAAKSGTRSYEASADGTITATVVTVAADGKESKLSRTFKVDGADFPVKDSAEADSISERKIDTHTTQYTEKKAGKVTITARRTVSKDGKTLTVHEAGTDEAGKKFDNRLVYTKE